MRRLFVLILFLLIGCAAQPQVGSLLFDEAVELELPVGFSAERLPIQFNRPTQFIIEENLLWIAQINGGENERRGQVLRVDLQTGDTQVIVDNLDKPTGLAVTSRAVWIATRDEILRGTRDLDSVLHVDGEPVLQTIKTNLPNNGRSNGTLTVLPDGLILYETSGNKRVADSGKLWTIEDVTWHTTEVAHGIKGGYAHAVDAEGRIFFTDMGDGSIDGEPLIDEINLLIPNADYGWPTCYGRDLKGSNCDGVQPAVATFSAHSTPTSLVPSPFRADELLVALWVRGEVVSIPLTFAGDNAQGDPQPFVNGFDNPQHLFVADDDTLWVSDYIRGELYRISRVSSE